VIAPEFAAAAQVADVFDPDGAAWRHEGGRENRMQECPQTTPFFGAGWHSPEKSKCAAGTDSSAFWRTAAKWSCSPASTQATPPKRVAEVEETLKGDPTARLETTMTTDSKTWAFADRRRPTLRRSIHRRAPEDREDGSLNDAEPPPLPH